ncbi:MAG: hypothetical protein EP349_04755 [Alphaproteobacteria bacterium]|nr:MAG: hypothetical protein EP349_04755 [Alphaproteobacteria bacterium]
MAGAGEWIKYHVMNTLEHSFDKDGKLVAAIIVAAAASGGFFITDAVNDYHTAMDNQGIEAVETASYEALSNKIVDFQRNAQALDVMQQKLDYYDDLSRDERTPQIIDEEAALQQQFADLQRDMNTQVKEISVDAFTSGNTTDGVAIGEEALSSLWKQLDHTSPNLQTLNTTYDIQSFPAPSFAYLDEARAGVEVNHNAPLDVQFNAASEIASDSSGSALGNGFGAFLMILLTTAGIGIGGGLVNSNRKNQFGRNGHRPKPQKPRAH